MLPRIVNIVSTCSLNINIDLRLAANHLCDVEYKPEKFIGIIMKFKTPKSTVLIFPNGKLVITGTKTENDGKRIARKTCQRLRKLEFNPKITDFKIQNIVSSFDLKEIVDKQTGTIIDLNKLAQTGLPQSSYEPEIFPAFICVINKIKIITFHTGKVNFTGAKTVMQIMETFELFLKHLLNNNIVKLNTKSIII